MGSAPGSWRVDRVEGTAAEFHGRERPRLSARHVFVHQVREPALVLGSTQAREVVDDDAVTAAGVAVVRRRSGGGAVLVEPGGVVWVDVVVPTDDPLWDHDVGRAFTWVGRTWATALGAVGVPGAEVHQGGLVSTPWSGLVCFGGLGPGEVTVGGATVVGLAQRRTRAGAWFQGAALLRWAPGDLLDLVRLDPPTRAEAQADLARRAAPLAVTADDLVAAFLASLPS